MNNSALLAPDNDLNEYMHGETIGITSTETGLYFATGKQYARMKANKHWMGKAETWREYLSSIGKSKTRVNKNIAVYKTFVLDLKLNLQTLCKYTIEQLDAICPVVKDDPDHWFAQCTLSLKDLINETRKARGKTLMPIQTGNLLAPAPFCIICGATPAVQAHWPVTDKMGGKFTIPLCAKCHNEYHVKGDVTFYKNYKRTIGEWLARGARL